MFFMWEILVIINVVTLAEDEMETKHLEAMEGAKGHLHFFEMDLLDTDSIAAAIKGCAGVFHLACPNIIGQVKDPEVRIQKKKKKNQSIVTLQFIWYKTLVEFILLLMLLCMCVCV